MDPATREHHRTIALLNILRLKRDGKGPYSPELLYLEALTPRMVTYLTNIEVPSGRFEYRAWQTEVESGFTYFLKCSGSSPSSVASDLWYLWVEVGQRSKQREEQASAASKSRGV